MKCGKVSLVFQEPVTKMRKPSPVLRRTMAVHGSQILTQYAKLHGYGGQFHVASIDDPTIRSWQTEPLQSILAFPGRPVHLHRMDPTPGSSLLTSLRAKTLVFTVTAGRSGTKLLATLLAECMGVDAEHEPAPRPNYVLRSIINAPEAASWWLLSERGIRTVAHPGNSEANFDS